MATFPIHTPDTVAPEGRDTLETVQGRYGFVPNLYGKLAEAPAAAKAYLELSGIFGETSFTETERQVILLAVSALNGCDYCVAAHSTIAQMGKVPQDIIDAIRDDQPLADARLQKLREFAVNVVENRGWVAENDVNEFIEEGFTTQNVIEVILGVALKTLSNFTNHIVRTEVDAAFQPNAWQAPARDVA